jgi:hypothetical protein
MKTITTKQITVQIKSVYGKQTIYPVCDDAILFAKLTGNKTLSQGDIATIKGLGYTIAVQPQTL